MAKKIPKGPSQEQAEFVLIGGQQLPLTPLSERIKNHLESQRKYRLGRMEEHNNRAIQDLRLFSKCPEDQMVLLFNDAVWLFRHVIRYAIDIRHADDLAREFNLKVDQEMQIPLVLGAVQNHLLAASAAVELICKLGAFVLLDTIPLRIALSEMQSLITSSPDLHSYHASREVWPDIIHVVGRHLSSPEMGRLVAAGKQADDVITKLRILLADGFSPVLVPHRTLVFVTHRTLLVGVKKGANGNSKMILEALLRSNDLRVGLSKLCQEIFNGTRDDHEQSLAASILLLNQNLKAQKISCHIERESNVYFVAGGIYVPKPCRE